jgi:hypothetical protein
MRLRLLFAFAIGSAALAAIVIACSDQTNATAPGTTGDASTDGSEPIDTDSGGEEDGDATTGTDGGAKADAKADAKAVRDANGPGEAGDDCVFNYDCKLALRCECDQGTCTCQPGARGTGQNGVDKCDGGEQCASSLCVEGPGDGGVFYCSDECGSNADCTGMLPKCKNISFIGEICVRDGG